MNCKSLLNLHHLTAIVPDCIDAEDNYCDADDDDDDDDDDDEGGVANDDDMMVIIKRHLVSRCPKS